MKTIVITLQSGENITCAMNDHRRDETIYSVGSYAEALKLRNHLDGDRQHSYIGKLSGQWHVHILKSKK